MNIHLSPNVCKIKPFVFKISRTSHNNKKDETTKNYVVNQATNLT